MHNFIELVISFTRFARWDDTWIEQVDIIGISLDIMLNLSEIYLTSVYSEN